MCFKGGSLISQRGPQNNNEIGDPGSPKFYDTGSGSPGEDWGELAIQLQKQKKISIFLGCSCELPNIHP